MPHQRRKSGHSSTNTSMTDVRRAVTATDMTKYKRPSMSRRQTPVSSQKLGRSHRDRERERDYLDASQDERESFPQYCMTCEKQFIPQDDRHLYCSDTCRRVDQNSTAAAASMRSYSVSHHFSAYSPNSQEPKDIIPRASPSRPSSMLLASSPPTSPGLGASAYTYSNYGSNNNQNYHHHTSAISALRSLQVRPPSPPSPTGMIWPFTRSAATSPSTSYTRPSAAFLSSTFDSGYAGAGAYTYDASGTTSDRPLPSRHRGSHGRPKSIELVTPMVGR